MAGPASDSAAWEIKATWLRSFHRGPMPQTTCPRSIVLPDLLSYCHIPLRQNASCDACAPATDRWIASSLVLSEKSLHALAGIRVAQLASMAYPTVPLTRLRLCADFIHWLFHLDDLTDDLGTKDSKEVADIVLNVLHWPERYANVEEDESKPALVRLTYDMLRRVRLDASSNVSARFIESLDLYLQAVYEQAILRASRTSYDTETYIRLRRADGGAGPAFVLIEYAARTDLPEWVLEQSIIRRLENAVSDMMTWSNDLYSFNKEQARGDPHNLVSIIMREKGIPLQAAVDLVGDMWKERLMQFTHDRTNIPLWGAGIDTEVNIYVQGLADWVVASLHWSFVSQRYFSDGQEVKENRTVELLSSREVAAGA